MKNLVLLGERRRGVNLPDGNSGNYVVDVCHVVLSDDVYSEVSATVVLTNNGLLSRITDSGDIKWTCNLEEMNPGGKWFDVAYNDPELVCLSKNGSIVSVSPSTGEAELVGVFDYGLEIAVWSPDGEVLLMVSSSEDDEDESKANSVLISMNTQFEVLAEVTIPKFVPSSGLANGQISAAWRPDGSLCAVSSVDEEDGMRKVRMYKRETLELHALGRSEDASGTLVRNIQNSKVAWASAGCSQLLASVQRKGKKTQQIVFFESNGLRHREFVLREAPTTNVTSLTWNVDSDLLAVALREEGGTDKVQLWHRCNYHWYMKREFRYPGQQVVAIKFDGEKSSDFFVLLNSFEWLEYEVRWDPSTILTLDGKCPAFVVDGCSLNITPLDKALIPPPMFMSSSTLNFPICETFFSRSGDQSGFILATLSNGSIALLRPNTDGKNILVYENLEVAWSKQEELEELSLRSFVIVQEETNSLKIVAVSCAEKNETCEKLVEITLSGLDTAVPSAEIGNITTMEGQVLRMARWADSVSGCLVQMQDGSLLEYESTENMGSVVPCDAEPLLEACPWICAIKEVAPFTLYDDHDDRYSRLVFGLSAKSRLYFHDVMLTDSASSLFLSMEHEFLCYATAGSRCQLRFLPLYDLTSFDPFMGADQQVQVLEGYEPRNVERGARLVAILPSQPMAILQMPRGNLEGIYPRALVLRFAMTKINAGKYGEAFRMMRKHKLDLNILIDFDPWNFLEKGIKGFLSQVENIDHLNLFISNLKEFDITRIRFPVPEWFRRDKKEVKDRSTFDFSTKVSQVCRKARAVMLEMEKDGEKEEGHFLLPVLSTFAKENPPRLDEALNLIKDNALKNPSRSKKNPLFSDIAQQSIHYLAFLAEYELLFETALGMYDYEIARAIARNSQMDPRVYLPLLKRLNSLPPCYGKYEVDLRLKRYELALRNLHDSYINSEDLNIVDIETKPVGNRFENCVSLINDHNLYQLGLELFKADNEKRRQIFVSLGEHLMKKGQYQTALYVFLAAEPAFLDGAKRAARSACDWRYFFSIANGIEDGVDSNTAPDQLEMKSEQRRQLGRDIASDIVVGVGPEASRKKKEAYSGAARILLDYGDDLYGAIDMLLNGECWREAHRVSHLYSRQDLVKKCVDAAISYAYTAMEDFEDKCQTFVATNERYAEVLKLRKKNIFVEGPELLDEADETGSLFSVASQYSNMSLQSNASGSSITSNVSSVISVKTATTFTMTGDDGINKHRSKFNKGKKKKRKKRKPRRKPGSIEELDGLVQTLRLCCANDEYSETIAESIQYLIFVDQSSLATEIFNQYQSMMKAIDESCKKRVEATSKEKENAQQTFRIEGEQDEANCVLIELPIEKEMDELAVSDLPETLRNFFRYLLLQ
jgi:elongator complex protein 1